MFWCMLFLLAQTTIPLRRWPATVNRAALVRSKLTVPTLQRKALKGLGNMLDSRHASKSRNEFSQSPGIHLSTMPSLADIARHWITANTSRNRTINTHIGISVNDEHEGLVGLTKESNCSERQFICTTPGQYGADLLTARNRP